MMAQHDPEGQGELARRAERIELAKWAELTKRKDRADLIEYVKRAGPMSGDGMVEPTRRSAIGLG